MNSALQCLSNTEPLTKYFLFGFYKQEINKENKLGSKGNIASAYAQFIGSMWQGNKNIISPWDLKKQVTRIAPMFSGFQQHDSHEFLSFLLDGVHEDLCRITEKPYLEVED